MGFAPVAAVAILLLGGLASLAAYTVAHDASQGELRRATQDAARRDAERTSTALTITSATYLNGPNRLTLLLTNTGSQVVETGDIDVVVDGVVRTSSIAYVRVGGSADAYWAPQETAEIRLDGITTKPARVAVVAHNGVTTYAGVA